MEKEIVLHRDFVFVNVWKKVKFGAVCGLSHFMHRLDVFLFAVGIVLVPKNC